MRHFWWFETLWLVAATPIKCLRCNATTTSNLVSVMPNVAEWSQGEIKAQKVVFIDQRTNHHIVNPHFFKQANYYVASSSKQVDQWGLDNAEIEKKWKITSLDVNTQQLPWLNHFFHHAKIMKKFHCPILDDFFTSSKFKTYLSPFQFSLFYNYRKNFKHCVVPVFSHFLYFDFIFDFEVSSVAWQLRISVWKRESILK